MPRRKGGRKKAAKAADIALQLIISPSEEHTHTVIMLHGSYYDGTEFEDLPKLVKKECKKRGVPLASAGGIKYVFPHSPCNDDGENFWYDYEAEDDAPLMQCDNDVINLGQWNTQVDRITNMVRIETNMLDGDASKVILGGNSAGGGLAIHVALQMCPQMLGALICLRTCPMRHTLGPKPIVPLEGTPDGSSLAESRTKGMPVLVYQAGLDDTYIPDLTNRNYKLIGEAGFRMEYKVNEEGTHEDDDELENPQVAEWVVRTFFKWGKGKTATDEDDEEDGEDDGEGDDGDEDDEA